jgi:23S rRNA pseudouridine1911/1915/1917 synthase
MQKRVLRRAADDPPALGELLVARLRLSSDQAVEVIARGGVYVGSERVTDARRAVAVGEKLTVHLAPANAAPPPMVVAYRDEELAVVDKPAGLPSQAEVGQNADCLDALARRDLGSDARLMHRLDKDASGLVLVALRESSYGPLQHAMAEHRIDRRYVAVVAGELTGDGVIRARIGRHPHDQRLRVALGEHATAGEPAGTRYRALAHALFEGRPVSAVELRLETGRTHQLRVHLSSLAHPIIGDVVYGGPPFARMCLHAYALAFAHPHDGRPLRVAAPLPQAFLQLVPGLTTPST